MSIFARCLLFYLYCIFIYVLFIHLLLPEKNRTLLTLFDRVNVVAYALQGKRKGNLFYK